MTGNRKAFLWIMATLVCAAVAASIAFVYPTEVAKPVLGDEWQCHKSVIVTTCHRASRGAQVIDRAHARLADARPV
jgi:hypothetical protein